MHWCLDADPILGDFLVKYSAHASDLSVDSGALYSALVKDAEDQASTWDFQGRQVDIWKEKSMCFVQVDLSPCHNRLLSQFPPDYLPSDNTEGGGINTRWVSRSLEVCSAWYQCVHQLT